MSNFFFLSHFSDVVILFACLFYIIYFDFFFFKFICLCICMCLCNLRFLYSAHGKDIFVPSNAKEKSIAVACLHMPSYAKERV